MTYVPEIGIENPQQETGTINQHVNRALSYSLPMSMSMIDLYSTESWSISTALCVLSGGDEIGSFSAIVWSCCWWAPGRGDCPVASSRLSDQRQRRPNDRKCWAGNTVWSGATKTSSEKFDTKLHVRCCQKPVLVLWHQFSVPISGMCVIGITITSAKEVM